MEPADYALKPVRTVSLLPLTLGVRCYDSATRKVTKIQRKVYLFEFYIREMSPKTGTSIVGGKIAMIHN